MVFCIVALVVFGILGIFSASHRKLAGEAFGCVFRTLTLRKCESNFDQKMKTRISVGLLKWNKPAGKFVFRHFEAISWLLVILTLASLVLIVVGVYNWWAFGNCNGPDSNGFCVFNAIGAEDAEPLAGQQDETIGIRVGDPSASLTVVEFGCFSCPFTKNAEPLVARALQEFDGQIKLLWKPLPIPTHALSRESALAGFCANEQGKFLEFKEKAFENQSLFSQRGASLFSELAESIGLDVPVFNECLFSAEAAALVDTTTEEGTRLNVRGTPTFFIGSQVVVGPTAYEQLRSVIVSELEQR